jgi:hypothetical protein
MTQFLEKTDEKISPVKCVVIVYENPAIREHAVRFCERMSKEQKCPATEMTWCPFQSLASSDLAADVLQSAVRADVLIFAMDSRGDLPKDIKLWIELWLNKRGEREGALVGLLQREEPHEMASFREIYLRHAARRAGMDYLSHAAPTVDRAIPNSLDSYNERAGRTTSVLDTILHTLPAEHPPRM